MRILISRLTPSNTIGGAELSFKDISMALESLEDQVIVATNLQKDFFDNKITYNRLISPYTKSSFAKIFVLPILVVQYVALVIRFKPDIINPQSQFDQIAATIAGKIFTKPVVWRDPGDLVPQLTHQPKTFLQKLNKRLQLWALQNTQHIFTLNKDYARQISYTTDIAKKKISVIPSNILFSEYDKDARSVREKKSISDKTIIIGTVIRLEEQKGVQYLISAFKQLSKNCPNIRLWIVGDGNYRRSLERLSGNDPSIVFFGKQKNTSPYFLSFDIFVQPAEFEGWGRNVKEAMFFKLPVVGSETGGIAEQITDEETGLLFQPKKISELKSCLDKLLGDSALRGELAKNGYRACTQAGDWHHTAKKQVMPLFKKLAQKQ